CGAPLPPKTTRCPFCQTLNDVDLRGKITFRRGTTKRDCPRCNEALNAVLLQVSTEHIELDQCAGCHGLFFDPGELDAVLDGIEHRAEEDDHRQLLTLIEEETPTEDFEQVGYVSCPDCGQLMHRRNIGQRSGVIVDTCRDHGLWLDGGELRRLIRWAQAGGRRHHATQQAEKEKLEANLQKTPSTVTAPSVPMTSGRTAGDSIFGGYGRSFDAIDLIDVLGSVVRWLR
ncbi:MAG: zf-TFIIB domain-containing protein, partial [Acidobacteriota bacterium]